MEPVFNFQGSAMRSVTAFADTGLLLRESSAETRSLVGHESGILHPRAGAAEGTVGR